MRAQTQSHVEVETMSSLDQQLGESWTKLYSQTNPGCQFALFRWTERDTLVFQGAYVSSEDASDEKARLERRHPSHNYFIWDIPEELQ